MSAPGDVRVTREDEPGDGTRGDPGDRHPRTQVDPPGFSFADPSARTRSDDPADQDGTVPSHDRLPRVLAERYTFVRPLGPQGAQGAVAQYQDGAGRQVVIKVHRAQPATPTVWQLWQQAQAATEYVIELVECHLEDGYAYEVTDYAPGGSLAERDLRPWPLPPADVERVLRQLTAALLQIHTGLSQRLVHRDLAPGNVLVWSQDPIELRITDFGVAIAQRGTYQARAGMAGTPAYAAPEAAYGRSSPARDWWSLGMIVLELLQGHHPFEVAGRLLDDEDLGSEIGARTVPIDDGIDARWERLIRGLLTRDDRLRWNHEQVEQWLAGGKPEVADDKPGAPDYRRTTPFPIGAAVVYSPRELADAIAANWAYGAALVIGRQWQDLRVWAAIQSPELDAALADVERVFVPDHPVDRAVAELIVRLDPEGPPVFRGEPVDEAALRRLAGSAASGTAGCTAVETLDALYTSGSLRAFARLPGYAGVALLDEQWHRWVEAAERAATEAVGSVEALSEAHVLRGLLLGAAIDPAAEAELARYAAGLLDRRSRRVGWFRRLAEATEPEAPARHAAMILTSQLLEDPAYRVSAEISEEVGRRAQALRAQGGRPAPTHRPGRAKTRTRSRLASSRPLVTGLAYAGLVLVAMIGIATSTTVVEGLLSGGLLLAAGGCLAFGMYRPTHPLSNALLGGWASAWVGLALAAAAGTAAGALAGPAAGWPTFWVMWVAVVATGTTLGALE